MLRIKNLDSRKILNTSVVVSFNENLTRAPIRFLAPNLLRVSYEILKSRGFAYQIISL